MLKTGPFFCCFVFLFLEISFSLQKEEDFFKKKKTTKQKQDPFLALKTCPSLLRNILGPVFNASFFVFFSFFFWGGGAETPIFIVFSAKMQNLQKYKKEKRHYL